MRRAFHPFSSTHPFAKLVCAARIHRANGVAGMGALDNSTSTAPEGATAGDTIAGVFVTLLAAAVLAYSMVVQRHARPVKKQARCGQPSPPTRLSGRGGWPKLGAARGMLGR